MIQINNSVTLFECYFMPEEKIQLAKYEDALEALVKERTEELEESREMYKILAKASPVGLFRTDKNGHCVYVNAKWREISGMTNEEALGKGWITAIHEDDREMVFDEWNCCVESHQEFSMEYRFQTSDGIVTWVLGQASLINGGGKGHVGTITDITYKKEALPQLLELRDSPKCRSV